MRLNLVAAYIRMRIIDRTREMQVPLHSKYPRRDSLKVTIILDTISASLFYLEITMTNFILKNECRE